MTIAWREKTGKNLLRKLNSDFTNKYISEIDNKVGFEKFTVMKLSCLQYELRHQ